MYRGMDLSQLRSDDRVLLGMPLLQVLQLIEFRVEVRRTAPAVERLAGNAVVCRDVHVLLAQIAPHFGLRPVLKRKAIGNAVGTLAITDRGLVIFPVPLSPVDR